ncbi:mediator complex [Culex quinquefasciatus]|uniref:Mediator of RNA polymerase II transcription subunit 4 n=1 Tax=Culex quinquefasciatus TaxID=7176 RepID=B0WYF0_CULQU|nr:mediator complex [Culex quinquefasciatus]|eukprot:XP_001862422.1 mediator complex [Culex quinquefasciatus]
MVKVENSVAKKPTPVQDILQTTDDLISMKRLTKALYETRSFVSISNAQDRVSAGAGHQINPNNARDEGTKRSVRSVNAEASCPEFHPAGGRQNHKLMLNSIQQLSPLLFRSTVSSAGRSGFRAITNMTAHATKLSGNSLLDTAKIVRLIGNPPSAFNSSGWSRKHGCLGNLGTYAHDSNVGLIVTGNVLGNEEINQLQKQLKEAEYILATSIFQARQKLTSFAKATKQPVSSDELIKFADRKNASNAICAPLTWQQGDQRRPYPTDRDAAGLPLQLGPNSDLTINGHQNPARQNSLGEINRTGAAGGSGITPGGSFGGIGAGK